MTSGIYCPQCENLARTVNTSYGYRSECKRCSLWSWDLNPLVSAEVHELRKECHAAFDAVWQRGEEAYPDAPKRKAKKFRRITRNRGYRMIAWITGMPEPECHMGSQTDPDKLSRILIAAQSLTPEGIREWWSEEGSDWWEGEKRDGRHMLAEEN